MYSVNQVLGLLTHRPIGWVNFPRKSRVSFNYKSTRLCGGTFFTLLLEMKKKKGVTNPDCLKSLVNIFYKSSDYFGKSTFSSNTSQYKTCDLSYSDWLQFDVKENVEEFSAKITNPQSYQEILLKMEDTLNVNLGNRTL